MKAGSMRRKYLDEHDLDLYEIDAMYDRWLEGRPQPPFRDAEGYDPDRDEKEGPRSDSDPTDRYGVELEGWGRQ